ncbi:hypothetical protein [Oceanimonas doudoroffii]|uniref:hypothetical protein n=1 Tax=Oceanimonas doudoroffii TaxID=84158 RepID=UPI00146E995F|nr:hypothetical protein [Oceanimonas doudoroffii]
MFIARGFIARQGAHRLGRLCLPIHAATFFCNKPRIVRDKLPRHVSTKQNGAF